MSPTFRSPLIDSEIGFPVDRCGTWSWALLIAALIWTVALRPGSAAAQTSRDVELDFQDPKVRQAFMNGFRDREGMNSRPETIDVTRKADAFSKGQQVQLLDLTFRLPRRWMADETVVFDQRGVNLVARTPRNKAVVFEYRVAPREERFHPQTVHNLTPWIEDPVGFLRSFKSDLEFYEKAYSLIIDDLDGTDTPQQRAAYALLRYIKMKPSVMTVRIDGSSAHAYAAFELVVADPQRIHVDLFDDQGSLRAWMIIVLPDERRSRAFALELLKRVVGTAEFTPLPQEGRARRMHKIRPADRAEG